MLLISKQLKTIWPHTAIGTLQYEAVVTEHSDELWKEIDALCEAIQNNITIEDIAQLPHIHDTREAYKACGKKPSRYRVSSEALLRRVIQGKGLYRVNTIVDINNLVSLKSHFSLGTFDLQMIEPPLVFDIGLPGETYEGIGKGEINIASLPLFRDQIGPFGSPTSDSERAKVTLASRKFLTVIISFSGEKDLQEVMEYAVEKYEAFARATNLRTYVIT